MQTKQMRYTREIIRKSLFCRTRQQQARADILEAYEIPAYIILDFIKFIKVNKHCRVNRRHRRPDDAFRLQSWRLARVSQLLNYIYVFIITK